MQHVTTPTTTPALAELTTLRVGGPAARYVETTTEAELIDVVRAADDAGEPLLVVGGGSNLLVADAGFEGVVVRDVRTGIDVPDHSACAGVTYTVPAGTPWDEVVEHAVTHRLVGLEALSGIPGSTGATPVQNVGAYGQEVSETIATVRVWDRSRGKVRTLPLVDLRFGYRTSLLKRSMRPTAADPDDPRAPWGPTPRYVVLDVTFQLRQGTLAQAVRYPELARTLGVGVGERAPILDVRAAVLQLRGRKGMVLDAADHDTWSAGSFFTNPILGTGDRSSSAAAHARPATPPSQDVRVPVTGVRKQTAAAMVASAFTAPHASVFLTVDVTPTTALLADLRADRAMDGHRVTPLALVAKAVTLAVRDHPDLNARWDEPAGDIVRHAHVGLGIAAATPRGLLVPVVHDADTLRLPDLADALRALTESARAGTTTPADLSGGTLTITNVGVFGVDGGTPILVPGQSAIVAVGAVRRQPWEHEGAVALRDVLTLTVSFDHRVVDGEQASRFVADVGRVLARPASVLAMV
ncbi:UDP-N-acetylmuramate dehydrogenase [Cellulomonas septica]|uniref:UDP-N-acetylenolpyruvoylglucosamine reductase n=1 Tax=Cellulomonas septica TaxID=285080 RepID=A0ABX1JWV2_9CELL|nr:UDP-N-acetylmuramate dehydrogenase [Cellulomonas septica]